MSQIDKITYFAIRLNRAVEIQKWMYYIPTYRIVIPGWTSHSSLINVIAEPSISLYPNHLLMIHDLCKSVDDPSQHFCRSDSEIYEKFIMLEEIWSSKNNHFILESDDMAFNAIVKNFLVCCTREYWKISTYLLKIWCKLIAH